MSAHQPDPIDIIVGYRIRARRRELGLTQHDLATALGVRFQQIQKYETAANRISAARLYRAADALNVSVDWFFNHSVTPTLRATDGRPDDPYNGQSTAGHRAATPRQVRRSENG